MDYANSTRYDADENTIFISVRAEIGDLHCILWLYWRNSYILVMIYVVISATEARERHWNFRSCYMGACIAESSVRLSRVYIRFTYSRIQVLSSVLLADTSGYNLYPGYMYQV